MDLERLGELAREIGIPEIVPAPEEKIRLPTDANSEFLANRGLGDWAEKTVDRLVKSAGMMPVSYGDDNSLAAGEAGFREMYLKNRSDLWTHGKRPDILVFDPEAHSRARIPGSLRGLSVAEELKLAPLALAGLEVRGSKFRAKKYREVRAAENPGGTPPSQEQCFTPKVEDLALVLHWVKRYRVPHFYVQVFLDEIHLIPFNQVITILAARRKLPKRKTRGELPVDGIDPNRLRSVRVEEPPNSNGKQTYFIPLSFGVKVGEILNWEVEKPTFQTQLRESRLGRLDAFVVPVGGSFTLVGHSLQETLH